MIVIWMILILNPCTFVYAPQVEYELLKNSHIDADVDPGQSEIESKELDDNVIEDFETAADEKYKTPANYNYPLVMIADEEDLFTLPTKVNVVDGERIFSNGPNHNYQYLCPTDDPEMIKVIRKDSKTARFNERQCLFASIFDTSAPKMCSRNVDPYLITYQKSFRRVAKCGPNDKGQLYGFNYMSCARNDSLIVFSSIIRRNVNIFNFCYDHAISTVLYTRHRISSPSILNNLRYIEDLAPFESDLISTDPYGTFGATFQILANQIQQMGLVRHMMVPPKDMAFGMWKKALYHYANVKGMLPEVASLWDFIDERIRQIAKLIDSEFEIYMGGFPPNEEQFWYKIVHDTRYNRSVVIIVRKERNTKLKILKNCYKNCNFEKWKGSDEVKNYLVLIRCCQMESDVFDLIGSWYLGNSPIGGSKYLNLDDPTPPERGTFV